MMIKRETFFWSSLTQVIFENKIRRQLSSIDEIVVTKKNSGQEIIDFLREIAVQYPAADKEE